MLTNQRVTPSSSEPIRRRINEIHKAGAERGKKKREQPRLVEKIMGEYLSNHNLW